MKKLLFVIFLFLYSQTVWATAQAPDWIVYQDTEYMLFSNPMNEYFDKHPDAKPGKGPYPTNLWRGYIAKFKIDDKKLFLHDIIVYKYVPENASPSLSGEASGTSNEATTAPPKSTPLKRVEVSAISKVFPNQDDRFLSWYSGLLILPYGNGVTNDQMGYSNTFENYILLEIRNGLLVKERKFNQKDYETFKKKQFKVFEKTKEYKELAQDLLAKGYSEEYVDGFLYRFLIEYTSKYLIDLP